MSHHDDMSLTLAKEDPNGQAACSAKLVRVDEKDLHYLRSIYRQLCELKEVQDGVSLGGEVLADNCDWLDCFIDRASRV